MTLKLHLQSSEQKLSPGDETVQGLVSPSQAEAVGGNYSRLPRALEQLIKPVLFFFFFQLSGY